MINKPAQTQLPISDLIANRWSPRVFNPSHVITQEQKTRLAEAARWAPSANNSQPWKFAFVDRDSKLHSQLCENGLTGFNQTWAPKASTLVVALANKTRADGSEADKAMAFLNMGLATSQIVFEAEAMGLKTHYMTGIHHDEIAETLGTQDYWVVCVIAIGEQGEVEGISPELLEREQAPRVRKPLEELFFQVD